MTAEELVRQKYPNADIEYQPATNEAGQSKPITEKCWVVYSMKALGATALGSGASADQAWKNAAATIAEKQTRQV